METQLKPEDQIFKYYMQQYITLTAAYLINLCEN